MTTTTELYAEGLADDGGAGAQIDPTSGNRDISAPPPFVSLRDDAPAYWGQDILWILHASAEQTGGAWSLIEQLCRRNSGPPPHIHEKSDETVYILEGEATFLVDTRQFSVGPGGFVSIPKGTTHAFRIDTETCRLLNTYVPASWEAAVVAMSVPATARTLPPAGFVAPESDIPAIMRLNDMRPVQAPDLPRT